MFGKLFGRKDALPQPEARATDADLERLLTAAVNALNDDGRDGLPVIFAAAAIAGYVTQHVVIAQANQNGQPLSGPDFVTVEVAGGRTYVLGTAISRALVGSIGDPGPLLIVAGLDGRQLTFERLSELAGHSAGRLGHPDFGLPRDGSGAGCNLSIDAAVGRNGTLIDVFSAAEVPMALWPRFSGLTVRHAITTRLPTSLSIDAAVDAACDAIYAGAKIRLEDLGAT